jgi:hypothetical protein
MVGTLKIAFILTSVDFCLAEYPIQSFIVALLLVLQLIYISGLSHPDEKPPGLHELTEELNYLKLSQDGNRGDEVNFLYRIVEGTKWNVESVGPIDKKNLQSKSASSLSFIGGLQNVIEEVCEIIQLALSSTSLVQGLYCFGPKAFCLTKFKTETTEFDYSEIMLKFNTLSLVNGVF